MSSLYCVTDILLIFYLNLSSLLFFFFFFSVRFFSASHFSRELGNYVDGSLRSVLPKRAATG